MTLIKLPFLLNGRFFKFYDALQCHLFLDIVVSGWTKRCTMQSCMKCSKPIIHGTAATSAIIMAKYLNKLLLNIV